MEEKMKPKRVYQNRMYRNPLQKNKKKGTEE